MTRETELADALEAARRASRASEQALAEAENAVLAHLDVDPDETEQGLTPHAVAIVDAFVAAHRTKDGAVDPQRQAAIAAARRLWRRHGDDVQIDDGAAVTILDEPGTGVEGAAWVQAWLFVPADQIPG